MADQKNKLGWFRKHKVLAALLVLIVIIIAASAASSGSKDNNNSGTAKTNSNNKATLAKIGEPARDGKFEFTVSSVQCNEPEVTSPDSSLVNKQAQGQYCLLHVNVKNVGSQQQSFFSTNQKLLDVGSKQYSSDDTATAIVNPNNIFQQINPGNAADGTVVFDIPKDVTPITAELHDSAFSNGIKVSLQ